MSSASPNHEPEDQPRREDQHNSTSTDQGGRSSSGGGRTRFDLDRYFGYQPTPDGLPDPTPLARNLAFCAIEVLAGARDAEQLARWVTDPVFVNLLRRSLAASQRRAASGTPARRPKLGLLAERYFSPRPGVVEAAIVVRTPSRVRSIALRLEGLDRRWRASSLAIL